MLISFTLLFALMATTALISSMAIIIVRTMIVTPIMKIHDGLRKIREGNLSLQLDIPTKDEFGDLSEFFNETVNELKRSRREMKLLWRNRQLNALGQLASGVAHDFNNQLTAIHSSAQLLENRIADDPINKECLELISCSSSRGSELTQKLLDFGRQNKASLALIDIHTVVDDVLVLLSKVIDQRIEMTAIKTALSPTIYGDHSLLMNAIINMGINASHAMSDGGKLKITTKNIVHDKPFCEKSTFDLVPGSYLQIAVADTGCGIPTYDLERIFEPFYTTKEDDKGTGLGLALVHDFVLEHRGAVSVDSQVGNGTTFYIDLPIFQARRLD